MGRSLGLWGSRDRVCRGLHAVWGDGAERQSWGAWQVGAEG